MLEHYEEKSYLYGRRALKAHAATLLHQYMKKEEENMMPLFSGEMAREQGQHISTHACCMRVKDVRMDRTAAAGNDKRRG